MGTNYTLWRKGRIAPDRDGKIDFCLKCGRKGAVRFYASQPKPWPVKAHIYVIHQKRVLGPSQFGGVIWDAFDRCVIPIDEAGQPAPAQGNSVAGSAADHPDLGAVISGQSASVAATRAAEMGACEQCGRMRRLITSGTTGARGICGTCLHREERRINTREMWGRGRRGY